MDVRVDTRLSLRYNPWYWTDASLLLQGRNLERFGKEGRMLASVKDEEATPMVAHKPSYETSSRP